MLALFPSMKYKPWYALGELVDNAIQSYVENRERLRDIHRNYKLQIDIEVGPDSIKVTDNAAGIPADELARALTPAQPPPNSSGLSQFGIGMKSAACWYARRFSVTTSTFGETESRRVHVDIPRILDTKADEVAVELRQCHPAAHGTTVLLESLNQPSPTGRTLGKIRSYLRSMYRVFLRSGELQLTVSDVKMEYVEPLALVAPRWDKPHSQELRWVKNVDVFLPDSGRRIKGWVGIRDKGSTAEAGLALLYRGKVVVGAGSMAQDAEGSYRPEEVFGRTNSFAYQRIFGELDVSELNVAYSKDELIWGGEEDEFLRILRQELDSEPLPLLRMANGYRKSDHGQDFDVVNEVRKAVQATAAAAAAGLLAQNHRVGPPRSDPMPSPRPADHVATPPISVGLAIPSGFGDDIRLELVDDTFDGKLLKITRAGGVETIQINRSAPFMNSFANFPNMEIEPVLRVALAVGLAEIDVRRSGVPQAAMLRSRLNEILQGPLAHRTVEN